MNSDQLDKGFFQSDLEKLHILFQSLVIPTAQCYSQTGWMCVPFPPESPPFLHLLLNLLNRTSLGERPEDLQLSPAHSWNTTQDFQSHNPDPFCSRLDLDTGMFERTAWRCFPSSSGTSLTLRMGELDVPLSTLRSIPSALTDLIEPRYPKRFMSSILFYCWCFLFSLNWVKSWKTSLVKTCKQNS